MAWLTIPRPATHFMSPGSLHEGISVCHYHAEPFEVAEQSFTTVQGEVTCRTCLRWIAKDTVHKLEGRGEPKYNMYR